MRRGVFGRAILVTKSPTQLCLPSLKSLKGPTFAPPGPNEIGPDHFICRPISNLKGSTTFTPPAGIRVSDEFSPAASVPVTDGAPTALCLPSFLG